MGLLDQARADIEQITSDADGFTVDATFTAPNAQVATIRCLHTKHHLGFDTDGNRINAKNAHVSFAENKLKVANVNYPIRNVAGELNMKGHKVAAKDSTGVSKNYVIREHYPDETLGLIVCILGDFQ